MPELTKFGRDNADLAERFVVVGVHEGGPTSVAEVRREVTSKAAKAAAAGLDVDLLPIVVVDAESGMFLTYDPGSLGDMVLVDPRGEVAAVGDEAFPRLRYEMKDLRERLAAAGRALEVATDPSSVAPSLGTLFDMGLDAADQAADRYAETCPVPLASAVYEAMAKRGRGGVVSRALEGADAKRRKAALEVMGKHPAAEWVPPLLAFAGHKKTSSEDSCLALRTAFASDARHADLEAAVLDLAKRGTTPVRACALELLGRLGSPGAVARLLSVLAKDVSASARSKAALALAEIAGDEVQRALETAAAADKVESVRAAARQALELRAKRAPPPGR